MSSYRNETVLNLQQLIYDFERKLKSTKLVIKDYTGYPIHILLYNNTEKYLILQRYGETNLMIGSAVAAAVILILSLIKVEIEVKLKCWKKKALAKSCKVYPENGVDVERRPCSNLRANEMANLDRQLESIISNAMDQLKNLLRQAQNENRASSYSLDVNESILPKSATVPVKALYDAPI